MLKLIFVTLVLSVTQSYAKQEHSWIQEFDQIGILQLNDCISLNLCNISTLENLYIYCETFTLQNFRYILKDLVSNTKFFGTVTFTLNDDTQYHNALKPYLDSIRKLNIRLRTELGVDQLYDFYHFQERTHVSRQLSALCIYEFRLHTDLCCRKKPSSERWYKDNLGKAEQEYQDGCLNLSFLQSKIIEAFKMVYSNPSFIRSFRNIYDYGLLELATGNIENAINLADELIEKAAQDPSTSKYLTSQHYLSLGITYSEGLDYAKAIEYLSKALEADPGNAQAHFERAVAYFETRNFELAEQDFLISDIHNNILIDQPISQEFSSSLMLGLSKGAQEAAIEFFPSLLNSAYGLSKSLWVFTQNPLKSTVNFSSACYEAALCAVDYLKNLSWEQVQECHEELVNLYQSYENMAESQKGEMIGYLIGRFGVDVLIPGTAIKTITAWKKLRDANRVCNLEMMVISAADKEVLQTNALRFAAERELYFKNVRYNFDAHNKHVLGHNDYDGVRSIFTHPEPEKLLRNFSGKGLPRRGTAGESGFKETVDFKEIIGTWKNNDGTLSVPTTKGAIHYGKKGAHIVPADPRTKT